MQRPGVMDVFVGPAREGELAARVIGEVIRQKYAPALRVARYLSFMAEGRRTAWEAWQQTRDGFSMSMFQRSFKGLAEQIGLEDANVQIHAFAKEFIASFEFEMDGIVAGTLKPMQFDDQDHARMQDWLRLLEESERPLGKTLDILYGPQKKAGLFRPARWDRPQSARR